MKHVPADVPFHSAAFAIFIQKAVEEPVFPPQSEYFFLIPLSSEATKLETTAEAFTRLAARPLYSPETFEIFSRLSPSFGRFFLKN
jgi:hypothetical protein